MTPRPSGLAALRSRRLLLCAGRATHLSLPGILCTLPLLAHLFAAALPTGRRLFAPAAPTRPTATRGSPLLTRRRTLLTALGLVLPGRSSLLGLPLRRLTLRGLALWRLALRRLALRGLVLWRSSGLSSRSPFTVLSFVVHGKSRRPGHPGRPTWSYRRFRTKG